MLLFLRLGGALMDQTKRNGIRGCNGLNGMCHKLSVHPNNTDKACGVNIHTLQKGRVAGLIRIQ